MAILNPDHLLEQAETLIQPPPAGRPRQVNLRRAISAAYYAVFHAAFPNLQEERHSADYDPLAWFVTSDAKGVLALARSTIGALRRAPTDERKTFLFMLLFPPRR